jgi:hypothetical protein
MDLHELATTWNRRLHLCFELPVSNFSPKEIGYITRRVTVFLCTEWTHPGVVLSSIDLFREIACCYHIV